MHVSPLIFGLFWHAMNIVWCVCCMSLPFCPVIWDLCLLSCALGVLFVDVLQVFLLGYCVVSISSSFLGSLATVHLIKW